MSLKGKTISEIQSKERNNKWSRVKEDGRYEDLHLSQGPGRYQLFNEFPTPDFKRNWVAVETDLKNLHCPDTYYADYNKCLQKVDMNGLTPYYHVQPYYSAQDHTLLTDDNKRLKGPRNPRQDYVVLKYDNKINPNHFSANSVLNFKDKYQNKYKQKLQQTHDVVADPGWSELKGANPIIDDEYNWKANGINYSYRYTVRD